MILSSFRLAQLLIASSDTSIVLVMLHSINDNDPAQLSQILPTLQRMEDNSDFLEHGRRRFDSDEPPPPYSPGGGTEVPYPNIFRISTGMDELLKEPLDAEERYRLRENFSCYRPRDRYDYESTLERRRIHQTLGERDQEGNLLYRGPDLVGRAGDQRLWVVVRHCKKKQWKKLRAWNDKWRIPRRVGGGPNDDVNEWQWGWEQGLERTGNKNRKFDEQSYEVKKLGWPAVDEESMDERAIRLHLERQGATNMAYGLQAPERKSRTEASIIQGESLITSRPWYLYELETEERAIKYSRFPRREWEVYGLDPGANVKREWEEKSVWKDSWGDKPGWRWRHESPSPEPEDLNDIEFTPSEIDALDSVVPRTPSVIDHQLFADDSSRSEGYGIFDDFLQNAMAQPMPASQPSSSREGNGSEATTKSIDRELSVPVVNKLFVTSTAEGYGTPDSAVHDNHEDCHGLQPFPPDGPQACSSSSPTRPTMQREGSVGASTAQRRQAMTSMSPGRTRVSRISKSVGSVRRSARSRKEPE